MKLPVEKKPEKYKLKLTLIMLFPMALVTVVTLIGFPPPKHNLMETLQLILIFNGLILFFEGLGFLTFSYENAIIHFEEDIVRCVYLGRTQRKLPYDEIKTYGTFNTQIFAYSKYQKYIFITVNDFTEKEKSRNTSDLYRIFRSTKKSVVLQHNDEAFEFLKEKCPNIVPWVQEAE